jgi:hypothetical protein
MNYSDPGINAGAIMPEQLCRAIISNQDTTENRDFAKTRKGKDAK